MQLDFDDLTAILQHYCLNKTSPNFRRPFLTCWIPCVSSFWSFWSPKNPCSPAQLRGDVGQPRGESFASLDSHDMDGGFDQAVTIRGVWVLHN